MEKYRPLNMEIRSCLNDNDGYALLTWWACWEDYIPNRYGSSLLWVEEKVKDYNNGNKEDLMSLVVDRVIRFESDIPYKNE